MFNMFKLCSTCPNFIKPNDCTRTDVRYILPLLLSDEKYFACNIPHNGMIGYGGDSGVL